MEKGDTKRNNGRSEREIHLLQKFSKWGSLFVAEQNLYWREIDNLNKVRIFSKPKEKIKFYLKASQTRGIFL